MAMTAQRIDYKKLDAMQAQIRKEMLRQHVTFEDLSELTGYSLITLKNYIRDDKVSLKSLKNIADALDIPFNAEDLKKASEKPAPTLPKTIYGSREDQQDITPHRNHEMYRDPTAANALYNMERKASSAAIKGPDIPVCRVWMAPETPKSVGNVAESTLFKMGDILSYPLPGGITGKSLILWVSKDSYITARVYDDNSLRETGCPVKVHDEAANRDYYASVSIIRSASLAISGNRVAGHIGEEDVRMIQNAVKLNYGISDIIEAKVEPVVETKPVEKDTDTMRLEMELAFYKEAYSKLLDKLVAAKAV